jgi:hypothetical protein
MGQKVNPNIFRLGKTIKWKQQYFEKKSTDIKVYSFKNLEIKNFIHKFFQNNGLIVHNLKLHYLDNNSLHIFVSYYLTLNFISLLSQEIKEKKIRLKPKRKANRKNFLKIQKNVKNFLVYQQMNYNQSLNTVVKTQNRQQVKQIIQTEKNTLKHRRLRLLKLYKQQTRIANFNNIRTLQFNSFLEKLFKSLQLFLSQNMNIYLTVKQLNKDTKNLFDSKKTKIIKKGLVRIKKYEKNEFFKEGVNTLFACSTEPNSANLLAEFLANNLQQLKRHNFFLRFIKSALAIFKNQNIKIKIKGRLNGAPRAKRKIMLIGNGVAALNLSSKVDYAEKTAYTSNGTIGVKVWIQENLKKC